MSSTSLLFRTKNRNFCWRQMGDFRLVSKLSPTPVFVFSGLLFANLVEVAELPEKNQQLLVELDLLGRVWQVSLSQWVGQQPCQALQYKVKVLQMGEKRDLAQQTSRSSLTLSSQTMSMKRVQIQLQ